MRLHGFTKALLVFTISLIGFLFLIFIIINLPFSHRFVADRVNQILIASKVPVHVSSVKAVIPGSVFVQGILVSDTEGDTIISVSRIRASFSTLALLRRRVILPSVFLDNTAVNLSKNSNSGQLNIAEAFTHEKQDPEQKKNDNKKPWEVVIGKAVLSKIRFRMADSAAGLFINQDVRKIRIDIDEMSIPEKTIMVSSLAIDGASGNIGFNSNSGFGLTGLDLRLSDLHLGDTVLQVAIDKLNFDLDNGFSMKKMKARLDSHSGKTVYDLDFETEGSRFKMEGFADANFFDIIKDPREILKAKIDVGKSKISLSDVFCFKPDLQNNTLIKSLAAEPINLEAGILLEESVITFPEVSISQAHIGVSLQGEIENFLLSHNTRGNLQFRISGIDNSWLKDLLKGLNVGIPVPDFKYLSLEGTLSDSLISPKFDVRIKSDLGKIGLMGSIDFRHDSFSLKTDFDNLMLGNILNNQALGSFSGSGEINGKGLKQKSITAQTAVVIDSIHFNNYNYTGSRIECDIRPHNYDLRVMVNDPSLEVYLNATLSTSDSVLSATADGSFLAGLNDLHLLKDTLLAEGKMKADFSKNRDQIKADILMSGMKLTTPRDTAVIRQIRTTFASDTSGTTLNGDSEVFNISVNIEKPVRDLASFFHDYIDYMGSLIDPRHGHAIKQLSSLPVMNCTVKMNYHEVFRIFIADTSLTFRNIAFSANTKIEHSTFNYGIKGTDVTFKTYKLGDLNASMTDSATIIDIRDQCR